MISELCPSNTGTIGTKYTNTKFNLWIQILNSWFIEDMDHCIWVCWFPWTSLLGFDESLWHQNQQATIVGWVMIGHAPSWSCVMELFANTLHETKYSLWRILFMYIKWSHNGLAFISFMDKNFADDYNNDTMSER